MQSTFYTQIEYFDMSEILATKHKALKQENAKSIWSLDKSKQKYTVIIPTTSSNTPDCIWKQFEEEIREMVDVAGLKIQKTVNCRNKRLHLTDNLKYSFPVLGIL